MDLFSLAAIKSTKDGRQTSPLAPKRARRRRSAEETSEDDDPTLSKIERLRRRTRALQEAHSANSQKALADERLIRDREDRAQLLQLSLRGLLDIVDRQAEVAGMDLARTMYDAPTALSATLTSAAAPDQPMDDSGAASPIGGKRRRRPPSPVQSALDKRNAQLWKERLLQDLDAATAGLLSGSEEDCDVHLSSSRKILAIIHQLTTEATESDQMCNGTRQAVNSELEFFLFGGHGDDTTNLDDPDLDRVSQSQMGTSSAAMRAKTRGGRASTSSLQRHKMTRLSPSRLSPIRVSPSKTTSSTRHHTASAEQLRSTSSALSRAFSSPAAAAANPQGPTASSVSLLHTFAALPAFEDASLTSPVLREHQAQLSSKLQAYSDIKARWSRILVSEMRPLKRRAMVHISKFQISWLKILATAVKTREWGRRLEVRRFEIAEEKAKIEAVIKMQSIFRGGFERSLFDKFTKVREMLLRRLWIIRLNIHTKQRKDQAKLVRKFLKDFVVNANPFKTVIAKFRWKIIWTQRAVRGFLLCKRARMKVLTRKWLRIEVKVARARKEKEEAAIRKAFSSMLEDSLDDTGNGKGSGGKDGVILSDNERIEKEVERRRAERKKIRRSSSAGMSLITGRPRSPSPSRGSSTLSMSSLMSRSNSAISSKGGGRGSVFAIGNGNQKKTEMAAKKGLRKMSRRASFGTTSQIALAELRKNMELVENEQRKQTQVRLIKAMEDCSTLSRKLDYAKNSKKKRVKLTRALLKKLSSKNDRPQRVGKSIRTRILLTLYRKHRASWSGRPPRPLTTNAETIAAAKLLLSAQGMPNPKQIEEVKASARLPEVWIFYSLISDSEMAALIKEGFREQEKETKASASAFWESLG